MAATTQTQVNVRPTVVVCITTPDGVLLERIVNVWPFTPAGRPQPTHEQIAREITDVIESNFNTEEA